MFGKGFGFYNWKRIPEGLNPLPLARGRDRVGALFHHSQLSTKHNTGGPQTPLSATMSPLALQSRHCEPDDN